LHFFYFKKVYQVLANYHFYLKQKQIFKVNDKRLVFVKKKAYQITDGGSVGLGQGDVTWEDALNGLAKFLTKIKIIYFYHQTLNPT